LQEVKYNSWHHSVPQKATIFLTSFYRSTYICTIPATCPKVNWEASANEILIKHKFSGYIYWPAVENLQMPAKQLGRTKSARFCNPKRPCLVQYPRGWLYSADHRPYKPFETSKTTLDSTDSYTPLYSHVSIGRDHSKRLQLDLTAPRVSKRPQLDQSGTPPSILGHILHASVRPGSKAVQLYETQSRLYFGQGLESYRHWI
jgi:hypothetical protein